MAFGVNLFAKAYIFLGCASEQPIEHLHKKMNEDSRTFAAIVEEQSLFKQMAKLQTLRNFFFDKKSK